MSMFDKAKCKVKWKGLIGEHIDSEFGILQGGMLSPQLLTEFLTDLHSYLRAECGILMSNLIVSYILFADDLILWVYQNYWTDPLYIVESGILC